MKIHPLTPIPMEQTLMGGRLVLSPSRRAEPWRNPHGHIHRSRSSKRGMLLVEATVTLSIITMIGLLLLKLSLNIIQPRQTILQQTLADAYMTYERAAAEQISFEELKTSPTWPEYPTISPAQQVMLGRTQGGSPVYGMVVRTRIPDENNLPIAGGTGDAESNPSALEVWRLQSALTFQVGERSYVKSRTVIRSQ